MPTYIELIGGARMLCTTAYTAWRLLGPTTLEPDMLVAVACYHLYSPGTWSHQNTVIPFQHVR
jgi:hypothetical protein